MTAYLIENPPRVRQFRERGTTPSGVVVVHTAESVPDTIGIDAGAEGVARFIQGRSDFGSYHDLCDSDSIVDLVPYGMQAYGDGTGSNPHAYHVSAATQADRWPNLPDEWKVATVRNMATAANRFRLYCEKHHGFTIPARRISRAESERRVEGFISHAERDPARRHDPGSGFLWDLFLETYDELANPKPDKPRRTRGERVDTALRKLSGAITELQEIETPENAGRAAKLEAAIRDLRAGRRDLRSIRLLDTKGNDQ